MSAGGVKLRGVDLEGRVADLRGRLAQCRPEHIEEVLMMEFARWVDEDPRIRNVSVTEIKRVLPYWDQVAARGWGGALRSGRIEPEGIVANWWAILECGVLEILHLPKRGGAREKAKVEAVEAVAPRPVARRGVVKRFFAWLRWRREVFRIRVEWGDLKEGRKEKGLKLGPRRLEVVNRARREYREAEIQKAKDRWSEYVSRSV